MALVKRRLWGLGTSRKKNRRYSPAWSLIVDQMRFKRLTKRYRRWLLARA
jgi:hypothetical protein